MNRPDLVNAITGLYLTGNKNVYKISSPNGRHHRLVNKSSLAGLLGAQNQLGIHRLNRMISKTDDLKYIARNKLARRNVAIAFMLNNPNPNSHYNNFVSKQNYVFRKWNNIRGMTKIRNPTGFSQNLKLANVNHYTLTANNLRNLRALHRQNKKNEENFRRQQAAKNAERRKYVYSISYYYPDPYGRKNIRSNSLVNANFKYMVLLPKNATLIHRNHESYPTQHVANIKQKFRHWATTILEPNYNMSKVNIKVYKTT